MINGSMGMVLGLLGGIVVGSFINTLYQALGGGQYENMARQVMARTIGWAIFGLFFSAAPGVVLKNWKRFGIGLVGGFTGGLLGGLLFDLIAELTSSGVVSRFVAIVAIEAITGIGTGLIEKATKTGWVRVVAGLIAGKQFIIYRNPTCIGSSPQCEIYLFKDTQVGPRHAAIHTVRGGDEIEDLQSPTGTFVNGRPILRGRLRNNDQVQIGTTVFQFQEKCGPHYSSEEFTMSATKEESFTFTCDCVLFASPLGDCGSESEVQPLRQIDYDPQAKANVCFRAKG